MLTFIPTRWLPAFLAGAVMVLLALAGCGHKQDAATPTVSRPVAPPAAAPSGYAAPAAPGGADAQAQRYQALMQQHPGVQPGARTTPATGR